MAESRCTNTFMNNSNALNITCLRTDGWKLGEHGAYSKTCAWETDTRVPLVRARRKISDFRHVVLLWS
eukprot:SAG11_NODE_2350_length_3483_cov_3.342494_3_plen_68_part_00